MSVSVTYPVEVKQYKVSVRRDRAEIALEGVGGPVQGPGNSSAGRVNYG